MPKKLSLLVLSLSLSLLLTPPAKADFTSPAKNISNSALDSKFPKVCHVPGGGTTLVLWVETDGSNDRLYFSKTTDSGYTWSTPVALTSPGGQLIDHANDYDDHNAFNMEIANPYVHIVMQWRSNAFEDYEIYYLRSPDLGDSWEYPLVQLTDNGSPSLYPDVAAKGEYVHVAYQDTWPGNLEIIYKRINNYGAGAVDQTRRLTFSGGQSSLAKIAVCGTAGYVNIVYQDDTSGSFNVFYKRIENDGSGIYTTRQLTFGSGILGHNMLPDIAAGTGTYDQYVYIVHEANWPGNLEIMYKSIDGWGSGSVSTSRLTYSGPISESSSIDFDTGYFNVHVCFHDSWPGNNDVMYRKLAPTGGAFTSQRVSWGTGESVYSTIASSGAWAYIAWMDNTSGNYEIYVKYGF